MMIAKFEKSELSIRLADKMDNMDRTCIWFTKGFLREPLRICSQKVIDLSESANGKVVIMIKIFFKVIYYLVIAIVAYITTRDGGDYYADSDLSNMETHNQPSFHYKLIWAFVVSLLLSI